MSEMSPHPMILQKLYRWVVSLAVIFLVYFCVYLNHLWTLGVLASVLQGS